MSRSEKEQAKELGKEMGLDLSNYLEKLARDERMRRNGRKYREIMDNLPADEKAALNELASARMEAMIAQNNGETA